MERGRYNVAVGLWAMGLFMVYGFLLIYLRDFHADKEAWIAQYGLGKHFEMRLAHVHGNLLALLNVIIGFVLARVGGPVGQRRVAAWLSLLGMVMPLGIFLEVTLGAPPYPVLLGALSMVAGTAWTGVLALRHWEAAPAPA